MVTAALGDGAKGAITPEPPLASKFIVTPQTPFSTPAAEISAPWAVPAPKISAVDKSSAAITFFIFSHPFLYPIMVFLNKFIIAQHIEYYNFYVYLKK